MFSKNFLFTYKPSESEWTWTLNYTGAQSFIKNVLLFVLAWELWGLIGDYHVKFCTLQQKFIINSCKWRKLNNCLSPTFFYNFSLIWTFFNHLIRTYYFYFKNQTISLHNKKICLHTRFFFNLKKNYKALIFLEY